MKNYRKAVEERRETILQTVDLLKEVTVEELAKKCRVSQMTIRRDLQMLEDRGLLKREYGKAVSTIIKPDKLPGDDRDMIDPEIMRCRRSISKFAARLVEDGDCVFINGSRTALDLLDYVRDKRIRVYTNNGWVLEKQIPDNISVIVSGGELAGRIMVGAYVLQNLLNLTADKTFIGCGAVYDDGEFRYDIPTEIGINELLISRTQGDLYILADHTKLQRRDEFNTGYGSCRYHHEVNLITDGKADPLLVARLREQGINVILVSDQEQAAGDRNG